MSFEPTNYTVLFDFGSESFMPWPVLAARLAVVACAVWMGSWGRDFAGSFSSWLFAAAFGVFSIYAVIAGVSSHKALEHHLAIGATRDVEGVFQVVARDNFSTVYAIDGQRFRMSGLSESRAFNQSYDWVSQHLVDKCVRARFTPDDEIVWLGIRREGCDQNSAP